MVAQADPSESTVAINVMSSNNFSSQLGFFRSVSNLPDPEDAVVYYNWYPYTAEIDTVLRPHLRTLCRILISDESLDPRTIPILNFCKGYPKQTNNQGVLNHRNNVLVRAGDLSNEDRARVANWIHYCLPGASLQEARLMWIGKEVLCHAFTLMLAHRHNVDCDKAFTLQRHLTPKDTRDMDRECLETFERRLFTFSKESGRAGNKQWGLDVGNHQDRWQYMTYTWDGGSVHPQDLEVRANYLTHLETCSFIKLKRGTAFSEGSWKPRKRPQPKKKRSEQIQVGLEESG